MTRPLILLEFDDVVVCSRASRRDALRRASAHDDVSFPDDFFDDVCAGESFTAAARAVYARSPLAGDQTAIELAALRATDNFRAGLARGAMLAPGAAGFIRRNSAIADLGIVARWARDDVVRLLELAGIADAFSSVVGEEPCAEGAPDAHAWTLARTRLSRHRAAGAPDPIALVASAAAFTASRAAGCRPIVVGELPPALAFSGVASLATLDGTDAAQLLPLVAGPAAR